MANDGQELFRKRVDTPRHDYQNTLQAIATLVADAEQATGQQGSVGVGIPGTLSPFTGKVKNANSVWLNGQMLDKDLSELLSRPVRLANDANCLAVSEATDGAGLGNIWYLLPLLVLAVALVLLLMAGYMQVAMALPVNGAITLYRGKMRKSGNINRKSPAIVVKKGASRPLSPAPALRPTIFV